MKDEIAVAFLAEVVESSSFYEHRKYFQNMAAYKYDGYQQYFAGKRFIESFALWLKRFNEEDRKIALKFIREKLIYISNEEMNALVSSCYQDKIKNILVTIISKEQGIPHYKISQITKSKEFEVLLRQSLFCGLSDGARIDVFRRANPGIISHEQIYQTYELSMVRANKMRDELIEDVKNKLGNEMCDNQSRFKLLFLLDDFSASGSSYLKINDEKQLKGKVAALYDSIYKENSDLKSVFDIDNLEIHIILYLCTQQAEENIRSVIPEITKKYPTTPELHVLHLINHSVRITSPRDQEIIDICNKEQYYDKKIEDKHTTGAVKLCYRNCALPLVLEHNTPNNSLSILWAYENLNFVGLFPRIPRHREI
ncbi:MAG: phosphoribosyltransferase-like protein [Chitinophagaceae bacterium]